MSAGRPSTEEVLAAVGVARERHTEAIADRGEPADPATRVLDSLGREWMRKLNGSWAALGHDISVDSLAQIESTYGPCEVLS